VLSRAWYSPTTATRLAAAADIKAVNSSINAHYNANTHGPKKPSTLKCWVFQA
jgi:hypothetical protein